jgi:hypothetical protein
MKEKTSAHFARNDGAGRTARGGRRREGGRGERRGLDSGTVRISFD